MRQRRIMAFNRGASDGNHSSAADAAVADVFLLSTRAGGLGINLATVRDSPKQSRAAYHTLFSPTNSLS